MKALSLISDVADFFLQKNGNLYMKKFYHKKEFSNNIKQI
ncbi:hypothetical protein BCD_0575 [Borrelia crocidurae DOU]|uniref:Uncharacterized protein n=1 Tax=Borrelia crocidurae DOU TaxID=1293575 RepID=W5SNG0_9SPIR|nr:hypothetical protein BCD_0575 [Borrelia crocidurae DOU]